MNLRHYEIFRLLVRNLSVTQTAKLCNLSQPAVTKAVRSLEDSLGLALFSRVKGRLRPTRDAEMLAPQVERLLSSAESVRNLTGDLRAGVSGYVTFAATPTLAASLVPEAMMRLRLRHPGIGIDLRALPLSGVATYMTTHQADLGLVHHPVANSPLQEIELFETEMVCVMRTEDALAHEKVIEPDHLTRRALILYPQDTPSGTRVRDVLANAKVSYSVGAVINQSNTALALVEIGCGLAILEPYWFLKRATPNASLTARPFRPRIPIRPTLLVARNRSLSRAAEQLLEEMKETSVEYKRLLDEITGEVAR